MNGINIHINMHRALRLALQFIIPAAVSIGLCLVMFRELDFSQMVEIARSQCQVRYILLMLLLGLVPLVMRALRWNIQLHAIGIHAPFHAVLYAIFGTYAVNLVFPRLGEVWRCSYLSVRQRAPFSGIFGSMIADRLADTLTVLAYVLLTLIIAHAPLLAFIHRYPAAYSAIAAVAASPITWLALALVAASIWLLFRFSHNSLVLKCRTFAAGIWQGFAAIARMRGKGRWLIYTLVLWGFYFLQLYVAFFAFPFTRQVLSAHGPQAVLVCYVLTSIAMGIPSNGGIGPYQATMIFALAIFMPAAADPRSFALQSAAFGNVIMFAQTLFLILLGLITFLLIALDRRHPKLP